MNEYYVYGYVRSKDSDRGPAGSFYYIGKGLGRRAYMSHRKGMVKVPADPAQIKLIATGLSEPDALQLEVLLIHLYGRVDLGSGALHNMTNGGEGCSGRVLSPISLAKMSASRRGKGSGPNRDDWKAKISAARKGIAVTQEHKDKLRLINLGKKMPAHVVEILRMVNKGRPKSAEHRAKISKARAGKTYGPLSPETKAKMSAAHLGHTHSPETKAKMKEAWVIRRAKAATASMPAAA